MGLYARSPELMQPEETVLVVVDVQEKLLPHISNAEQVERNVTRLISAAAAAKIPVVCTEQYPKGLGSTVPSLELDENLKRIEKLTFSCAGKETFRDEISSLNRRKLVLCGIETHVCVMQTALDLLSDGYSVYLVLDAIGSRFEFDHDVAIRRLEAQGVTVSTTESCLFEWCERAGTDLFREIRKLVLPSES